MDSRSIKGTIVICFAAIVRCLMADDTADAQRYQFNYASCSQPAVATVYKCSGPAKAVCSQPAANCSQPAGELPPVPAGTKIDVVPSVADKSVASNSAPSYREETYAVKICDGTSCRIEYRTRLVPMQEAVQQPAQLVAPVVDYHYASYSPVRYQTVSYSPVVYRHSGSSGYSSHQHYSGSYMFPLAGTGCRARYFDGSGWRPGKLFGTIARNIHARRCARQN